MCRAKDEGPTTARSANFLRAELLLMQQAGRSSSSSLAVETVPPSAASPPPPRVTISYEAEDDLPFTAAVPSTKGTLKINMDLNLVRVHVAWPRPHSDLTSTPCP